MFKFRFHFIFLLIIIIPSLFLSLAKADIKPTAVIEKKLNKDYSRIVSLAPVITEILLELGLLDKIVGVTSYCNLPNDISQKNQIEEVGAYLDTSIEKVLSLKPDIVLTQKGSSKTPNKLRALKLEVIELPNESVSDIIYSLKVVGKILNVENKVELHTDKIENNLKRYLSELKEFFSKNNLENPSFLILLDEGSSYRKRFYVAGKKTFYDDILNKLSLKNSLEKSEGYVQIGLEGIISLKPKFIFILRETENLEKEEESKKIILSKLKNTKLIFINSISSLRPGINLDNIAKTFKDSIIKSME